jgi:hypothetical protein
MAATRSCITSPCPPAKAKPLIATTGETGSCRRRHPAPPPRRRRGCRARRAGSGTLRATGGCGRSGAPVGCRTRVPGPGPSRSRAARASSPEGSSRASRCRAAGPSGAAASPQRRLGRARGRGTAFRQSARGAGPGPARWSRSGWPVSANAETSRAAPAAICARRRPEGPNLAPTARPSTGASPARARDGLPAAGRRRGLSHSTGPGRGPRGRSRPDARRAGRAHRSPRRQGAPAPAARNSRAAPWRGRSFRP